jgi:stage II sporulation protein AB (anti-sigma F factor)
MKTGTNKNKGTTARLGGTGAINTMRLEVAARSENESFARGTVAAFASQLNPTLDEINDIKTAVSEAVTNCVVHAYAPQPAKSGGSSAAKATCKRIIIECALYAGSITVSVTDFGVGIKNIDKAMEPFFTTKPDEERSGMGFTVMQSFMDTLAVTSNERNGTTVTMQKFFTKERKKASGEV